MWFLKLSLCLPQFAFLVGSTGGHLHLWTLPGAPAALTGVASTSASATDTVQHSSARAAIGIGASAKLRETVQVFKGKRTVRCCALHPVGELLVAGFDDGAVVVLQRSGSHSSAAG